MASVSVDASVVDHTLPTYFAGIGAAYLRASTDFPATAYRNALTNLNPEIIRLNPFHSPGPLSFPNANWTAMKNLLLYLGSGVGVWMGPTGAHPIGQPSTTSEVSTTNYEGSGAGRSPSEAASWYQNFVNAGINVLGMEFYNEPDNCASGSGGNGGGDGPWYGPGGSNPAQSDINKCVTWAAQIHRQYRAAVANLGIAMPKIGGGVISAPQSYAQTWAKHFAAGVSETANSWPYGDGNWSYFDVLSFHPYQRGSTNQGKLNSIYYNPSQATIDGASAINLGTMSFLDKVSAYFAAQGHSDKKIAYNEYGEQPGTAFSGLVEVAQAILGFGWAKQYGIDYISTWSMNASTDPADYPIMDPSTYTLNTRACTMRDMVFYFSRNYKKIVGYGQADTNTPSSGDSGGNNNAVPALVWVAGLNAANNKIAVLVANIDLGASRSFTFAWANATSTADGTYRQLLSQGASPTSVTGTTSLPSGSQTRTGESVVRTIEAGAAYLIEIPVTISGAGGAGGGGGTSFPNASSATIDTFDRVNGDVGSNYKLVQGNTVRPQISSNIVTAASFTRAVYLGAWYSADQETYITIKNQDQYVDLLVCYDDLNDTGYLAEYESDTHNFNVYRVDGIGQFVFLGGATTGGARVDGDVLGFRRQDRTLSTWLNGTQIAVYADATYLGGGRLGFGVRFGLDTFGGGGLGTPAIVKRHRGKRNSGTRSGSGGGI